MGQTILIADDSQTVRTVCAWLLKGSPYDPMVVEGGDEALAMAQSHQPKVIVLDYHMPGKDGYEVCRELKSDPNLAGIPVLMLGGAYAQFDESRAVENGADGSLMKPFKADDFLGKIEEMVAKAEAGEVATLSAPEPEPEPETKRSFPPPRKGGLSLNLGSRSSGKKPGFSFPSRNKDSGSALGGLRGLGSTSEPESEPEPATPPTPTPSVNEEVERAQTAPAAAAAPVAIDEAVLREEIQAQVKQLLPTIVRSVLKELITKEVTPHLQRWVESKVEILTERKIQAELERFRQ